MLGMCALEGEYTTIEADVATLHEAVADLRAGTWDGLNVTMPLKRDAAREADVLSELAESAKSVNTLWMEDGRVRAESTDATAFLRIMGEPGFSGADRVLVLGGGGTATAALAALSVNWRTYISTRKPDQAASLAKRFGGETVAWGRGVPDAVVVNATPVGMEGEALPDDVIDRAGGLVDLPYKSGLTPGADRAIARGIRVVDGWEFLVCQAVDSFATWTGCAVDLGRLLVTLRKP